MAIQPPTHGASDFPEPVRGKSQAGGKLSPKSSHAIPKSSAPSPAPPSSFTHDAVASVGRAAGKKAGEARGPQEQAVMALCSKPGFYKSKNEYLSVMDDSKTAPGSYAFSKSSMNENEFSLVYKAPRTGKLEMVRISVTPSGEFQLHDARTGQPIGNLVQIFEDLFDQIERGLQEKVKPYISQTTQPPAVSLPSETPVPARTPAPAVSPPPSISSPLLRGPLELSGLVEREVPKDLASMPRGTFLFTSDPKTGNFVLHIRNENSRDYYPISSTEIKVTSQGFQCEYIPAMGGELTTGSFRNYIDLMKEFALPRHYLGIPYCHLKALSPHYQIIEEKEAYKLVENKKMPYLLTPGYNTDDLLLFYPKTINNKTEAFRVRIHFEVDKGYTAIEVNKLDPPAKNPAELLIHIEEWITKKNARK